MTTIKVNRVARMSNISVTNMEAIQSNSSSWKGFTKSMSGLLRS